MAETTFIEWADATWNPWYGCTQVSPGCDNCYAQVWARLAAKNFSKVTRAAQSGFTAPMRWKEPRRIFVCSLSDFFHPAVPELVRHGAMQMMTLEAPQHTYMLLTKRPEWIKPMLKNSPWEAGIPGNVWLGVTAENQEQADRRLDLLYQVHAYTRFVSCEPLLGPVRIGSAPWLNWVICGGESGPNAREMKPAWAFGLRDKCDELKIPFFFKQWGEWAGGSRVGKKRAGSLLDGREYKELPV
jgi:protein gp37